MNISRSDRDTLVAIQKWVILDQALEECGGFRNRIFVVAGLRPKHGAFESSQVADTIGSAELVDENRMYG